MYIYVPTISVCLYVHNLVNLKLAMSSHIHMQAGSQKYISNVKELDEANP